MTDRSTINLVVAILGLFALGGLYFTFDLIQGKTPAAEVTVVAGLTGTAIGLVGGLLASTRTTSEQPQPVQVVNAPADPVPVEEGGE